MTKSSFVAEVTFNNPTPTLFAGLFLLLFDSTFLNDSVLITLLSHYYRMLLLVILRVDKHLLGSLFLLC